MSAGPKSTNMRVRAYVADFLSMLDQLQRHAEILNELCLQAVAVDLYLHDSGEETVGTAPLRCADGRIRWPWYTKGHVLYWHYAVDTSAVRHSGRLEAPRVVWYLRALDVLRVRNGAGGWARSRVLACLTMPATVTSAPLAFPPRTRSVCDPDGAAIGGSRRTERGLFRFSLLGGGWALRWRVVRLRARSSSAAVLMPRRAQMT